MNKLKSIALQAISSNLTAEVRQELNSEYENLIREFNIERDSELSILGGESQ